MHMSPPCICTELLGSTIERTVSLTQIMKKYVANFDINRTKVKMKLLKLPPININATAGMYYYDVIIPPPKKKEFLFPVTGPEKRDEGRASHSFHPLLYVYFIKIKI